MGQEPRNSSRLLLGAGLPSSLRVGEGAFPPPPRHCPRCPISTLRRPLGNPVARLWVGDAGVHGAPFRWPWKPVCLEGVHQAVARLPRAGAGAGLHGVSGARVGGWGGREHSVSLTRYAPATP